MRRLYRLGLAILCAALLLPVAVAQSTRLAQAPLGKAPSTLSRGVFGEPDTLAPRESGVTSAQTLIRDLFEGLTTFDAAGATIPGAALSWSVSPDGLVYTFRLRPNLRWSDGAPLRASDFVWGWQHSLNAVRPAARATRLYALRNAARIHRGELPAASLGARALDARTLQLTLEHPVPWLPTLLAGEEGFPLPRHVIERSGRDWAKPGTHVGNGAYRLLSRRARGSVLLERNPYHHDAARIAIDRIEYVPSNDTPSLVMRVRAGELAINGWPGFTGSQTQALTQSSAPPSCAASPCTACVTSDSTCPAARCAIHDYAAPSRSPSIVICLFVVYSAVANAPPRECRLQACPSICHRPMTPCGAARRPRAMPRRVPCSRQRATRAPVARLSSSACRVATESRCVSPWRPCGRHSAFPCASNAVRSPR